MALLLKDEEKAQSALKQSLDIRMKLLGKEHPHTILNESALKKLSK